MSSIRRYLNLWLLLGNGVLLVVAGLALDHLFTSRLERQFDQGLEAKARTLVTLTDQDEDKVELDFAGEAMPEFEAGDRPEYFQLWLEQIGTLERSPSLGRGDLPHDPEFASAPRFETVTLPDGRPGRLVEIDFVPRVDVDDDDDDEDDVVTTQVSEDDEGEADGEADDDEADDDEADDDDADADITHLSIPPAARRATIVVARGTDEMTQVFETFRYLLLIVAGVLMGGTAVLARVAVQSGLRPLDTLGARVGELNADNLQTRLDPDVPAELRPLVQRLNDLLIRLEEAFRRERQLTSDVAHELRTPVAELRTLSEVGQRWPDDEESIVRFFQDVHDIAAQMERLIANLLALARHENGIEPVQLEEVDLKRGLERICQRLGEQAREHGSEIQAALPEEPLKVRSDRDKLDGILHNLLVNAIDYAPSGSTIRCEVTELDPVRVDISNPAPNLTSSDLPHLFERFWRKDPSRTGADHAGIGLSLVKAFAEASGISLSADLKGGILTMTLRFPESGEAAQPTS